MSTTTKALATTTKALATTTKALATTTKALATTTKPIPTPTKDSPTTTKDSPTTLSCDMQINAAKNDLAVLTPGTKEWSFANAKLLNIQALCGFITPTKVATSTMKGGKRSRKNRTKKRSKKYSRRA